MHADRRADIKLLVAFRNFANVPKKTITTLGVISVIDYTRNALLKTQTEAIIWADCTTDMARFEKTIH